MNLSRLLKINLLAVVFLTLTNSATITGQLPRADDLWKRVEVIRTAHGVPHIRAKDLMAAGYGLAWMQSEDYGNTAAIGVLQASGRAATVFGYERIDGDLAIRRQREKTRPKYALLSKDVRDVYEGFAVGLNRYIQLHPEDFPAKMPSDLTGFDVMSAETTLPSQRTIRTFLQQLGSNTPDRSATQDDADDEGEGADDGSNAWAFAPSRTTSGKAILMRNPHLNWNAGYYEAHVTVPGVIDFYGDFRIGGPFVVIGGFNKDLGFSTTNNQTVLDQIYSFDVDPKNADSYILDGRSVPLTRELITASFKNGDGISTETREFWSTKFGPVIHRGEGKIYIIKFAGDGEARYGEQFLKLMRARTFKEWQDAMKMRARLTSNFTYADRAGNIYLLWNAALPKLPHPMVGSSTAVAAKSVKDIWTEYVPFESLPQFLNPKGGYVHNENSSPHYSNVREKIVTTNAYPNFEAPRLSLRSQLAIQLINGDDRFSLEDIVKLKHNYRALLADRVKPDLVAAVKATQPTGDVAAALSLIEKWDNTTSAESRGSALFELWWQNYSGITETNHFPVADDKRYAKIWSVDDPLNTPSGLADKARAAESFAWAVEETKDRYGSFDVSWGEVHRVRRGDVDVPVGGCGNDLGCFRVMSYTQAKDGKLAANGGDCWVLAVEFGDVPRAYSVLSYGQSRLPSSPYHADQAEMFAKGEMKTVAFTEADVKKQAVVTFRPGEKRAR